MEAGAVREVRRRPTAGVAPLQVQAAITPQRKVRSEMAGVGTLARDWKVKQAGE
jgi:hypothetical protein